MLHVVARGFSQLAFSSPPFVEEAFVLQQSLGTVLTHQCRRNIEGVGERSWCGILHWWVGNRNESSLSGSRQPLCERLLASAWSITLVAHGLVPFLWTGESERLQHALFCFVTTPAQMLLRLLESLVQGSAFMRLAVSFVAATRSQRRFTTELPDSTLSWP